MLFLALLLVVYCQKPVPLNVSQFAGKKVLFVVAHPDDIEGLAGGLVSILSRQNTEIAYLVATNGDKGGFCYNSTTKFQCSKEALAYTRRGEQLDAAAFFNIPPKNVRLLDLEDGMLSSYPEQDVRISMIAFIRTFQPFAVFTWFPLPNFKCPPMQGQFPGWGDLGYHPDHQTSGRICMDAVLGFGVSGGLVFDALDIAGIKPWVVSQFYMFALTSPEMTHYVDLDGQPLQDKIDSFLLHKSQYLEPKQVIEGAYWLVEKVGQVAGVKYAEGYQAFF